MKKIKGDFLTEREAAAAMDKISDYCGNIKILYGEYENYDNYYMPAGYDLNESLFDYPENAAFNFGIITPGFMTANYNLNSYISENRYTHARNFFGRRQNYSGRAVLEADVADDNFEYVKNKLYSSGAISVV